MKQLLKVQKALWLMLVLCCFLLPATYAIGEQPVTEDVTLEGVAPDKVDSVLARLSDEQIRKLLIAELKKDAAASSAKPQKKSGLLAWLDQRMHTLDHQGDDDEVGAAQLLAHIGKAPTDVLNALENIGGGQFGVLVKNLFLIFLALVSGIGVEYFFRRLIKKASIQLPDVTGEEEEGLTRLWAALINILPPVVHITVFAFASIGVFILFNVDTQPVRSTFMAVLVAIVLARGLTLVSRLFCSPEIPSLRLLPLEDSLAHSMHQGIGFLVWYVSLSLMFLVLIMDLGAPLDMGRALGAVLGTILFVLLIIRLLTRKKVIAQAILGDSQGEEIPWVRRQFAAFWHILALLYLFGIWVIWFTTLVSRSGKDNGALFISLLIVPIYLIFDKVGQWLIGNIITTLGIASAVDDEEKKKFELGASYVSPEEREQRLRAGMTKAFRGFSALVLFVWLMTLWGFDFPFAINIVGAAFDILVTLTLALIIWRFASRFIERKIEESTPEEEAVEEEDSSEFGSAKQLGRSYTLLPMLRKFVAIILLVMVTLIVLSSIGLNIGPLLAGAGVIGLAIGFGAQKLVSDVLSGIFFLFDDAFRVGEYIKAGSVSGAVEAITLRNVMLRHHRGMLQIIPHSDLGAITNFMRGGVVLKFNLEFPYDTDVNKVRKIIKNVGQAMLQDEEYGQDFIRPVKSQGVREITGSVMVIRVKFTAHPGKQFVIRREAYRRITELLAAKGIHYAHRKVIVELPQDVDKSSPEEMQKNLQAGAAAGLTQMEEEEKKKAAGRDSGGTGMPEI